VPTALCELEAVDSRMEKSTSLKSLFTGQLAYGTPAFKSSMMACIPRTFIIMLNSASVLSSGLDLIAFTSSYWTGFSPLWMTPIWIALVLTLQSSMSWLNGRYLLAGLLGAISGPFAYWAGVRMGAGIFVDFIPAMISLSVIWLVITPALFYVSSLFKAQYVQSNN